MNRTHRNNHTRDAAPAYRPACRPARRAYSSHASATAPIGARVRRKRHSRFNRARNVLVAIAAIAGLLLVSGLANRLVVLIEPNAAATFLQFDEDEGTWSLELVNASNPLPNGFSVETADVGGGHSVDKRIADSLNAMLEDCKRAGGAIPRSRLLRGRRAFRRTTMGCATGDKRARARPCRGYKR